MVLKGLTLLFAGLFIVGLAGCPAEEEAELPVLEEPPVEVIEEELIEQPVPEDGEPVEEEKPEEPEGE